LIQQLNVQFALASKEEATFNCCLIEGCLQVKGGYNEDVTKRLPFSPLAKAAKRE